MKKRVCAIWWTISDIIGLAPRIYSHKMKLEVDHVPSMEDELRLNLPMQEVFKMEIIKWLDMDVVYPIINSIWDCLVQCIEMTP